ncbi:ATP-dependent zinc metalloprotease FtsH [Peristeroidobacter soli]|jgi:cell division protease FtsH|uniref:ATP-dependent zinc metalloprotease FtsH n=1 Tax=Peristeroidobacter soli TaxID=2497877 RepID=UPI00101C65B1|nr:ATP-dependent zinc metalloprotease FtsH [Peristeroidobacter soli]
MADPSTKRPQSGYGWLGLALLTVLVMQLWFAQHATVTLDYSDFKVLLGSGLIANVEITEDTVEGTLTIPADPSQLPDAVKEQLQRAQHEKTVEFSTVRVDDPTLYQNLTAAKVHFGGARESKWLVMLLSWLAPAVIFAAVWFFFIGKLGARGAGDLIGVGKSKAKLFVQKNVGVRFSDVEGIDEAKAELMEVVQFLRDPNRYTKLGGHIPKGILIVGAPGTGKTLLAKAVAGEANVPFLLISGSEFVEMFVGVGAARVRDLFHQASELAPCIIFIDELDALGRARGVNGFSSHEEREQTLNQLLVEMDGFETNRGVIIMAATNRPEILDPALLRPGRFDRHVAIDRPDIRGREKILRLHAKRLVLGADVDLAMVAGKTPGTAGADLANIVNEAALHAAREGKSAVAMSDFDAAIDRAIAGLEKRGRVMNPKEKETVAYHEAGHALIAELRATTDKVSRVSIIPRGIGALGFTQQLPTEDRYLMKRGELLDRLDVLLGGRVAEELVFGEVSTGASNDLQRATDLVRHMVTQYGMTETLGPAVFETRTHGSYLNDAGLPVAREFSEETARQIDSQIQQLLLQAEARVRDTLAANRSALNALAQLLLTHETVEREALTKILHETQRSRPVPTTAERAAIA